MHATVSSVAWVHSVVVDNSETALVAVGRAISMQAALAEVAFWHMLVMLGVDILARLAASIHDALFTLPVPQTPTMLKALRAADGVNPFESEGAIERKLASIHRPELALPRLHNV